jgi:hypothetical protein
MCEWLKQAVLKTYVLELATSCNQLNSKRIGRVNEIQNSRTVVKL